MAIIIIKADQLTDLLHGRTVEVVLEEPSDAITIQLPEEMNLIDIRDICRDFF